MEIWAEVHVESLLLLPIEVKEMMEMAGRELPYINSTGRSFRGL